MIPVSRRNVRRHAITVMACLLLGTLTQLAVVAWICLWADSSRIFAPQPGILQGRTGVLAGEDGLIPTHETKWIFWVQAVGSPATFQGPEAVVFHRAWGRWAVSRYPAAQPAAGDPTPITAIRSDWLPSWARGASVIEATTAEIARWAVRYDYAFGWPLPCLSASTDLRAKPDEIHLRHAIFVLPETHRLPQRLNGPLGFLPTRVLWYGMVLNVLIGACLWAIPFMLVTAARAARGRRRVQRGLCAKCGYGPWTGGSACPECGTSVGERGGRPPD